MSPRFVGTRPRARNPCCVFPRPASAPPSSLPLRAWPDCRCRVVVPFRGAAPARHCIAVPVWPLPPAPAGYACSAASRSASASPCPPSSSRRCTARSSWNYRTRSESALRMATRIALKQAGLSLGGLLADYKDLERVWNHRRAGATHPIRGSRRQRGCLGRCDWNRPVFG